MDRFRREPSEDTAANLHEWLLHYREFAAADIHRRNALQLYAGHAGLLAELASHLETHGLPDQAEPLRDEAAALGPDLPEVRMVVAQKKMQSGDLDEAREQLSFLEEPGAENQYNLAPLFDLANHFERKLRHEELLEILAVLLRAFPELVHDRQFRYSVQTAERVLKRRQSILSVTDQTVNHPPGQRLSSGQRLGLSVLAAVLLSAIGLWINNEYIRRHRVLTVVNDTGQTAEVQLNDLPPIAVDTFAQISVPEGSYSVRITGPVDKRHELKIESDFIERWTKQPAHIINVAGEALLNEATVYYAERILPSKSSYRLQSVLNFEHVDFLFEDPPPRMDLAHPDDVRRVRAVLWKGPTRTEAARLENYLLLKTDNPAVAYSYLKRKVSRHPYDDELVRTLSSDMPDYESVAVRQLLQRELERRPVPVELHIAYQDHPAVSRDYVGLRDLYAKLLKQHPDDVALTFLAARFTAEPADRCQLLEAAGKTNATNGRLAAYRAEVAAAASNWAEALHHSARAISRGTDSAKLQQLRFTALLALERFDDAEAALRQKLERHPADLLTALQLCEVLVVQRKTRQVQSILERAEAAFKIQTHDQAPEERFSARAMIQYIQGNPEAFVNSALGVTRLDPARHSALLELDNIKRVLAEVQGGDVHAPDWMPLQISLALFLREDHDQSAAWLQRQIEQLAELGPRYRYLTSLLGEQATASRWIDQIDYVITSAHIQALLLTHAATRIVDREERHKLLEAAERRMIRRLPPVGLLQKAHDQMRQKDPD
ncbi:MAG: hypothetical protein Fues2KO_01220 [Fuerstiella sp.]